MEVLVELVNQVPMHDLVPTNVCTVDVVKKLMQL